MYYEWNCVLHPFSKFRHFFTSGSVGFAYAMQSIGHIMVFVFFGLTRQNLRFWRALITTRDLGLVTGKLNKISSSGSGGTHVMRSNTDTGSNNTTSDGMSSLGEF